MHVFDSLIQESVYKSSFSGIKLHWPPNVLLCRFCVVAPLHRKHRLHIQYGDPCTLAKECICENSE